MAKFEFDREDGIAVSITKKARMVPLVGGAERLPLAGLQGGVALVEALDLSYYWDGEEWKMGDYATVHYRQIKKDGNPYANPSARWLYASEIELVQETIDHHRPTAHVEVIITEES